MDYSIVEGKQYGELFFPESHDYGVSVWLKPLSKNLEHEKNKNKKRFLENYMGIESLETYNSIIDFMSGKSDPLVDERAWYLSIIGILPEFQGQGLGIGLVESILQKADEIGVSTYLETFTPRNLTFYNRLGYQAIECFHEPATDASYWIMVRNSSSAADLSRD